MRCSGCVIEHFFLVFIVIYFTVFESHDFLNLPCTERAFTRSKLTIETTLEQGVKCVNMASVASLWCLYCYLWTYFTTCSSVSIVNFEQVNADWLVSLFLTSTKRCTMLDILAKLRVEVFAKQNFAKFGFWDSRPCSQKFIPIKLKKYSLPTKNTKNF